MLALAALAPAAPAAAEPWLVESIGASEGVHELHDLSFDAQGRGLLSWDAALLGHAPQVFGGLAARDPAGGWLRPPDLAGVDPASAQIHLYSQQRALLVAREGGTGGPGKRRLVVADGLSDGGFGALTGLATFTSASWSAANSAGDAIVAWTSERTPFLTVRERTGTGAFAPRRDLAIARSAAVAIDEQGNRLLAWPEGRRIAVRVRRPGAAWGRTVRFGRLPADRDRRLSAVIAPDGRMILTWGRDRGPCGIAVRDARGAWRTQRLETRCGAAAVGARGAPVLPFVDSTGATYVAWTHATRRANSVTLARVGQRGTRGRSVVSRQRGALLDDVAAGPDGAIAVTWAAVLSVAKAPLQTATYAGLRRAGATFDVQRLSPPGVLAARGSRVAFQPLTGQAVVAIPYGIGRTLAVGAAVSARAP
ncbi:MAG: hypothetical protein QOG56_379 [Solirubrobacteraceae bacterium]|nr:hypothetical protein [Solirubrobacteraceae bacterium]